jgi:peptidoglycan/xylan/chitin deacetylase (PgdA/CDA1 family)
VSLGAALALAFAMVAAAVLAYATFHRNSPLFGVVLRGLPGDGPRLALTFDDGPSPGATPHILDTLEREGVPATFFVLGAAAERWPELVRRARMDGHQIGNHGYAHRKLHLSGPAEVRRELGLGASAIERACGARPRFFRAPHGWRSPWVTPIARELGERTVGWTLGVWDTDRPGVDEIVERVLEGVRPGTILLLHDGDGYDLDAGDRMQTARALPRIIRGLRERGYRFDPLPPA